MAKMTEAEAIALLRGENPNNVMTIGKKKMHFVTYAQMEQIAELIQRQERMIGAACEVINARMHCPLIEKGKCPEEFKVYDICKSTDETECWRKYFEQKVQVVLIGFDAGVVVSVDIGATVDEAEGSTTWKKLRKSKRR